MAGAALIVVAGVLVGALAASQSAIAHPFLSALAVALVALPSFVLTGRAVRGWLLIGVLALHAWIIELVGLLTGFPYGAFSYSSALGPKIAGMLPVVLPFAYVPLVLLAWAVASRLESRWVRVLAGTALLVLADLVLDPVAVASGLWTFANGGAYLGVPLSNFAGWVFSGALACLWCELLLEESLPLDAGSSGLFLIAFFTGAGLVLSLLVPALLGVAFLIAALIMARVLPALDG